MLMLNKFVIIIINPNRTFMKSKFSFLLVLLTTSIGLCSAQHLKPGFNKDEYIEMLKISAAFGDSAYVASFPKPQQYHFVYRSPVVGLDNRWDLYIDNNSIAVISLRGTTANSVSWLANFYAAMVPATGQMQLSENENFSYKLADNPRAAVHAGWLVSMAFLAKDIVPKVDSLYKTGVKDMIILGHSQGGAIAYLLTAYFYHLQQQQLLPPDIRFKTYCSAGAKPGNLYFAYDYEALTQNGWAYNVVNSSDWVPEVPFSIQTVNDFNPSNPFTNAKNMISKQKFPMSIALRYAFNRLDKPTRRAQRNFEKYLGRMTSKMVRKTLKGFDVPAYYPSNDYVRTGTTIVLKGDSTYHLLYPDNGKNIFIHHFHQPYLYLVERLDLSASATDTEKIPEAINGPWELNFISGRKIAFEGLYPGIKPLIVFDVANKRISGNTGCNSFSGKLRINGNKIDFKEPMAMTKMFCEGEGEHAFTEILKKVTSYALNDSNELIFLQDNTVVMRFIKQSN